MDFVNVILNNIKNLITAFLLFYAFYAAVRCVLSIQKDKEAAQLWLLSMVAAILVASVFDKVVGAIRSVFGG